MGRRRPIAGIAGLVVVLSAFGVMIADSRLTLHKGEWQLASSARLRAAEAARPQPGGVPREEYLEAALAAEQEYRQLHAERATELDGYYLAQSRLLLVCWACLMLVGLGLWVSAGRTRPTSLLRPNPPLQQTVGGIGGP